MNVFLQDYYTRLKKWHDLKESLINVELETICVEVDRFWQQCPMVNHYLHVADVDEWPNPWELINTNNYCVYARALGMVYTLLLLGIDDIDFIEAKDDNDEDVVLVFVDHAKYVLNYWPDMVLNIKSSSFTVTRHIDITLLKNKIGIE